MIKKIIQYPTPLSVEYATDVRVFDEELFALIDDLKDTITENNLEGLSAYQIGSHYNVIVVKNDEGELIEMINPRLIAHSGRCTTVESTAYYPNKTAEIERYENVSIVYQNRDGNDCSLKASGAFAIVLQRKIDYTFGATFIHKMSKQSKAEFNKQLSHHATVENSDYSPTTFKRDKMVLVMNVMLALMAVGFVVALFIDDVTILSKLWHTIFYTAAAVALLDVFYFFYAQYEGRKSISCSSCQVGNIVGTTLFIMAKLVVITLLTYFFIYK
jgi:peptide deformylase